ncbi:MAG: hypothetical protein KAT65_02810 [Methanophagales archaeon]|nr:hypothetical protein [Methanophagales archaeon]
MEEGDIKGGGIIRKDFLPGITSAHATVRILFAILLMLLFAVIALATPSASSDIEIYAFDQNPAGSDKGKIYIPSMINLMPWKSGNQN